MALGLKRAPKFAPREPRSALKLATVLLLPDDREIPVQVENVSEEGFMGEASRELDPGTSLGISVPASGIYRAKVRWSEGRRFGAYYDKPLDPEVWPKS